MQRTEKRESRRSRIPDSEPPRFFGAAEVFFRKSDSSLRRSRPDTRIKWQTDGASFLYCSRMHPAVHIFSHLCINKRHTSLGDFPQNNSRVLSSAQIPQKLRRNRFLQIHRSHRCDKQQFFGGLMTQNGSSA